MPSLAHHLKPPGVVGEILGFELCLFEAGIALAGDRRQGAHDVPRLRQALARARLGVEWAELSSDLEVGVAAAVRQVGEKRIRRAGNNLTPWASFSGEKRESGLM